MERRTPPQSERRAPITIPPPDTSARTQHQPPPPAASTVAHLTGGHPSPASDRPTTDDQVGLHDWATNSPVVSRALDLTERMLDTYRTNPTYIAEHYGIERSNAEGGYGRRQLYELIQNGSDAALDGGVVGGRIDVVLAADALYCANVGEPITVDGPEAIMHSHRPSAGRANSPLDFIGDRLWILMLPEPQNGPAGFGEKTIRLGVSPHRAVELLDPPHVICGRSGRVLRTSVPEAAIQHHRYTSGHEKQVRSASNGGLGSGVHAIAHPPPMDDGSDL